MRIEIKKEINISNGTIANELVKDGRVLIKIDEVIEDMLCTEYNLDQESRIDAIENLNILDYIEILRFMANKIEQGLDK